MPLYHDGYVAIINGEFGFWHPANQYNVFLGECREYVSQYISDHLRHSLPIRVDSDVVRRLNIRAYQLNQALLDFVALPLQEWFDQYYSELVVDAGYAAVREKERKALCALRLGVSTVAMTLKGREVHYPAAAVPTSELNVAAQRAATMLREVRNHEIEVARLTTPLDALAYWWDIYLNVGGTE